ncbi:MAG TPA: phosphoribosylformylglycinamidine cyclo-ligase, partial [Jiangellaceae bacterium]|nr:phosphoribosylformylglycinamidine cyclo-ligase [Jiangellaceae bacterium]
MSPAGYAVNASRQGSFPATAGRDQYAAGVATADDPTADSLTYKAAGVDIGAGERAVELIEEWVAKARRPETLGGIGGFAGLFDASALTTYRRPLLATSTDGVGTKVVIAQRMDVHDTIGFDLVGMVVDDVVVCGAEPLFLTDYIACGHVVPERVAAIVKGIAQACVAAGCALAGGETAEHPGLLRPDEYDLAGAATGVVEADALLGPGRVRPGDAVVAMASSGLHANGYSLVRTILDRSGWQLDRDVPELGRSIGAELLEPTRIYAPACLALAGSGDVEVHAFAHVTGGGIVANLARVLPDDVSARVDRATWSSPPVFALLGALGNIEQGELERTLNMGIGMLVVVAADDADAAVRLLGHHQVPAWLAGDIVSGGGAVDLAGE